MGLCLTEGVPGSGPAFLCHFLSPLCAKCLISIDFTPRHVAQRVERVGLAPRRAPPRPTVERKTTRSPVVLNDIKHLTATCDRRARFRHPITARGSSHALLP